MSGSTPEVLPDRPSRRPDPGALVRRYVPIVAWLPREAAGVVFLAVGESLSAARSYATRHRQETDGDQELVGLGMADATAGLLGGFIADASLSQTAARETAGQRTQLS
jgi:MFS superfamily sulfate permease-like transporter